MRIGLIADIHGNLPAAEAALAAIKKHKPDQILSLGDQINLGPCPREVLALLNAEDVQCLHGNHERYILSAIAGDEHYKGANFDSLRFNATQIKAEEIRFPKEIHIDPVTFCHALPDDDRFPVNEPELALPKLREMRFEKKTHIICGHGHNPTHYRVGNLTLDSIGSTGCMDDGVPGVIPYTLLDIEHGDAVLRPLSTTYDPSVLPSLFKRSGMAAFCPIMAHIACLQMQHNHDYLVGFVTRAATKARMRKEAHISRETWVETDAEYSWPDGIGTAEFWRQG